MRMQRWWRGGVLAMALALLSAWGSPVAGETYCPNPGLNCHKVLVIPVKYTAPYCPDPGKACPPDLTPYQDPPRITASQLGNLLNQQVNPHFSDWSYGTWQFQFDVVANPDSTDGWWPMPAPLQDYHVALLAEAASFWDADPGYRAIVKDAIEGIAAQASMDGLIPSLVNYSRFIVLENNHTRGGQANGPVSYTVPVFLPAFGWIAVNHIFTGTWAAVDVSDAALETLLSHELMHQLGPVDFYGLCLIKETPLFPFIDECNGPWDVLAWDQAGPNHPTAYNKTDLGWLPTDPLRISTLPVAGTSFSKSLTLYPLETLDASHLRLARIPLSTPLPGAPFEGYHLECRRAISGDGGLTEEGVLIQWVQEAKPGVGIPSEVFRPARVIRSDPPFNQINEAALQPSETWIDAAHGVSVEFTGYADGTPAAACNVQVAYANTGAKPDPAFLAMEGSSPDLWMDSAANGLDVYPPGQSLDADGVPSGQGDPFQTQVWNRLRFRVRNLGTAVSPVVGVRITADQPAWVACNATPPKIFDQTVFVPPIDPGDVGLGFVDIYIPGSQLLRVKAKIQSPPGEISLTNNAAERTFNTGTGSAVVTPDGPSTVVVGLAVFNYCPEPFTLNMLPKTMPVLPIPQPDPVLDRWRAITPGRVSVPSGLTVTMSMSITPPFNVAPGNGVMIPVTVTSGSGLNSPGDPYGNEETEIDAFLMEIPVVEPAMLTAAILPGPHDLGSAITISGTLTPDRPGTIVALRFTSFSQPEILAQAATDGLGNWSAGITPPAAGAWGVRVFWQGDDTRSEAAAPEARFLVVAPAPCVFDAECDDGNACTQESCDRVSGSCGRALLPDGAPCDDGDLCTAGDMCLAGSCGRPVMCDDLDTCTLDSCDPATGQCLLQPAPLPEIEGLIFPGDGVMEWQPGSGASYWNVYRGTIPSSLMGSRRSPYDDGCLESDDAFGDGLLSTAEFETPPVGSAWYYRVTAKTVCGEGPAGSSQLAGPLWPPNPCASP